MAIYMKYGDIEGQVTTEGYAKWIQLESFSMGIQRDTKNPTGRGSSASARESSAPQISEIHINKSFDSASTKIIHQACNGAFQARVDIAWTTTTKSKTDTFLTVRLQECGITSYETSSNGRDGGPPMENITLNFTRIEWRATPLNSKGLPEVSGAVAYDLLKMTTL